MTRELRDGTVLRTQPWELQPTFTAQVDFDGDDYPPTMLANVTRAMKAALEQMKDDGLIVGYALSVRTHE